LLCVQWKTPDDGQRNCPKHVEFYSKNKFEKSVHLVGFIIRKNSVTGSRTRRYKPGWQSPWYQLNVKLVGPLSRSESLPKNKILSFLPENKPSFPHRLRPSPGHYTDWATPTFKNSVHFPANISVCRVRPYAQTATFFPHAKNRQKSVTNTVTIVLTCTKICETQMRFRWPALNSEVQGRSHRPQGLYVVCICMAVG